MVIGSALVVFGLFLGSLVLGGWWFTIFVVLLMVVSVGEFYATVRSLYRQRRNAEIRNGEDAFVTAWNGGLALSLDDAAAEVLQADPTSR